jgi:hypothetical protein
MEKIHYCCSMWQARQQAHHEAAKQRARETQSSRTSALALSIVEALFLYHLVKAKESAAWTRYISGYKVL